MQEVTYDALRKRLAQAEEELSIWKSVFPDIAPERVLPDRSLLHAEIEKLRAALQTARRDALEEAVSRVKAYSQNETARNIVTIIYALGEKE
jgi:inorganic triphosphatase YgiF